MPLEHSSSDAAFKRNVSTLMGEVGKSPHVQSRAQALAIAYSTKRRGRGLGGAYQAPWFARQEARGLSTHSGPVLSAVAGRTDHHPTRVGSGSYVLPADHVSSLGQGNTLSGMNVLNRMFKMGPYGSGSMPITRGKGPPAAPKIAGLGRAAGGNVGEPTPVAIAGGEFVIPPEKILEWMHSSGLHPNLKAGHEALDKWVVENRKNHVKTLKKLPPPVKE